MTRALRLVVPLVALSVAWPNVASAAGGVRPLPASGFTERAGSVSVSGGRLVLRGRAAAGTAMSGTSFEAVSVRVRFAGRRCRGARAMAVVNGRARVLQPRRGSWRTYRLASAPSLRRRTFALRLRAGHRCRLLVRRPVLHLVAGRTFAPPAPRPSPAPVHTIELGAAIAWRNVSAIPGYADLFLRHFSHMTPENELKMNALQPRRDTFDFVEADRMVDWAVAGGKQVRGHTLVFKHQTPGWLTNPSLTDQLTGEGDLDRDKLLSIMRKHITTVMRHYAGRIREWDVVNEPLRPDGSYNPGIWLDTIGPEYVEEAFRSARAAVPDARLCLNEIGAEVPNRLADALFGLVERLKAQGLIDCVGFQMHVNAATPPALDALQSNLQRFATLGVDLHVTEMDVNVSQLPGGTAEKFAVQARIFGDAATACSRVPACTRFTTWGTTDASTWLGPEAQPLPFDDALAPKPAWAALQRGLAGG